MVRLSGEEMEREMGLEPTTAALEGRSSTAELLPLGCTCACHYIRQTICSRCGIKGYAIARIGKKSPNLYNI